jgi:hypothetical protein
MKIVINKIKENSEPEVADVDVYDDMGNRIIAKSFCTIEEAEAFVRGMEMMRTMMLNMISEMPIQIIHTNIEPQ